MPIERILGNRRAVTVGLRLVTAATLLAASTASAIAFNPNCPLENFAPRRGLAIARANEGKAVSYRSRTRTTEHIEALTEQEELILAMGRELLPTDMTFGLLPMTFLGTVIQEYETLSRKPRESLKPAERDRLEDLEHFFLHVQIHIPGGLEGNWIINSATGGKPERLPLMRWPEFESDKDIEKQLEHYLNKELGVGPYFYQQPFEIPIVVRVKGQPPRLIYVKGEKWGVNAMAVAMRDVFLRTSDIRQEIANRNKITPKDLRPLHDNREVIIKDDGIYYREDGKPDVKAPKEARVRYGEGLGGVTRSFGLHDPSRKDFVPTRTEPVATRGKQKMPTALDLSAIFGDGLIAVDGKLNAEPNKPVDFSKVTYGKVRDYLLKHYEAQLEAQGVPKETRTALLEEMGKLSHEDYLELVKSGDLHGLAVTGGQGDTPATFGGLGLGETSTGEGHTLFAREFQERALWRDSAQRKKNVRLGRGLGVKILEDSFGRARGDTVNPDHTDLVKYRKEVLEDHSDKGAPVAYRIGTKKVKLKSGREVELPVTYVRWKHPKTGDEAETGPYFGAFSGSGFDGSENMPQIRKLMASGDVLFRVGRKGNEPPSVISMRVRVGDQWLIPSDTQLPFLLQGVDLVSVQKQNPELAMAIAMTAWRHKDVFRLRYEAKPSAYDGKSVDEAYEAERRTVITVHLREKNPKADQDALDKLYQDMPDGFKELIMSNHLCTNSYVSNLDRKLDQWGNFAVHVNNKQKARASTTDGEEIAFNSVPFR